MIKKSHLVATTATETIPTLHLHLHSPHPYVLRERLFDINGGAEELAKKVCFQYFVEKKFVSDQ